MHGGEPKDHEVSALRKDDAYVLYIQRNRSDELASSFCLSWAAKRLSMLGMTQRGGAAAKPTIAALCAG